MNENVIIEKIKREIERFSVSPEAEEVGRVVSSGDGIVIIEGLSSARMAEMVLFDETDGSTLEEALHAKNPLFGLKVFLEILMTVQMILTEIEDDGDIGFESFELQPAVRGRLSKFRRRIEE